MLEGTHLPHQCNTASQSKMKAITLLCEWQEIAGWGKNNTKRRRWGKEDGDKMKCTRAEFNWITMAKTEEKSALKASTSCPPSFHRLIYIPQLLVLLISFRRILITAIAAQCSSHALWSHSLFRSSLPSTFVVYFLLSTGVSFISLMKNVETIIHI